MSRVEPSLRVPAVPTGARSGRCRSIVVALLAATLLLGGARRAAAAEPAVAPASRPTAGAAADASGPEARVPKVVAQGPTTRVSGKIVRSSRGRRGPVRLLLERPNGEKVTVLVAPDEYLERAGLSLRADETAEIEGSMLKGARPILIATAVVVDGRRVQIRDAKGKLVPREGPGSEGVGGAATAAGGGENKATAAGGGEGKATVGGGKPAD